MREIKFRGKSIVTDEWIYGDLIHCGKETQIGYFTKDEDSLSDDGYYEILVDVETVGQYTGLKDKNGKEIYKGDIIKYFDGIRECIGAIKFGEYEQDGSGGEYSPTKCLGFYIKKIRGLDDDDFYLSYKETVSLLEVSIFEKVGNIYENPELLEEDRNDI